MALRRVAGRRRRVAGEAVESAGLAAAHAAHAASRAAHAVEARCLRDAEAKARRDGAAVVAEQRNALLAAAAEAQRVHGVARVEATREHEAELSVVRVAHARALESAERASAERAASLHSEAQRVSVVGERANAATLEEAHVAALDARDAASADAARMHAEVLAAAHATHEATLSARLTVLGRTHDAAVARANAARAQVEDDVAAQCVVVAFSMGAAHPPLPPFVCISLLSRSLSLSLSLYRSPSLSLSLPPSLPPPLTQLRPFLAAHRVASFKATIASHEESAVRFREHIHVLTTARDAAALECASVGVARESAAAEEATLRSALQREGIVLARSEAAYSALGADSGDALRDAISAERGARLELAATQERCRAEAGAARRAAAESEGALHERARALEAAQDELATLSACVAEAAATQELERARVAGERAALEATLVRYETERVAQEAMVGAVQAQCLRLSTQLFEAQLDPASELSHDDFVAQSNAKAALVEKIEEYDGMATHVMEQVEQHADKWRSEISEAERVADKARYDALAAEERLDDVAAQLADEHAVAAALAVQHKKDLARYDAAAQKAIERIQRSLPGVELADLLDSARGETGGGSGAGDECTLS